MVSTLAHGLLLIALVVATNAQGFHGAAWEQKSSPDKQDMLWKATVADTKSNEWPNVLEEALLLVEQMNLTFDSVDWDEFMPNEIKTWPYKTGYARTKLIHSQGVVALVSWKSLGNHNYTGLFQGATHGLMRLSLAGPPDTSADSPNMGPGVAFKFLRDGMPASQVIAMYQLGGQSSFNFFEHDLTNHVPDLGTSAPFKLRVIRETFAAASNWPTMIGVSEFASFTQSGAAVPSPNAPFRVVFHPTAAYHQKFNNTTPKPDILADVGQALIPGSTVYEVWAQDSPYNDPNDPQLIGTLVLNSKGFTSMFGDKTLFMRHVRMEDDLALKPQWVAGAQAIINNQQSVPQYHFQDLPWQ